MDCGGGCGGSHPRVGGAGPEELSCHHHCGVTGCSGKHRGPAAGRRAEPRSRLRATGDSASAPWALEALHRQSPLCQLGREPAAAAGYPEQVRSTGCGQRSCAPNQPDLGDRASERATAARSRVHKGGRFSEKFWDRVFSEGESHSKARTGWFVKTGLKG